MASPETTVTTPNVAVHTSYNPLAPPALPGPRWTRFVCLSDTHSSHFEVPPGDVLLHSGDLSSFGKVAQLKLTMDWINKLPHPLKLIIAGNHDLSLDTEWYENQWHHFHRQKEDTRAASNLVTGKEAQEAGVIYLEYSSVEIQAKERGRKWKVYGSPGSPWFGGWAFNYERGDEAQNLHQAIPPETDILLTHGPPHSILDVVHSGEHVGCEELLQRLDAIRPVLHVWGHIHEGEYRGIQIHDWPQSVSMSQDKLQTIFVNAANMPSGEKARNLADPNASLSIGGPGFQPVIVDLFDPVEE